MLRIALLLVLGAGLLTGGLVVAHKTSGPDDAALLRSMNERLDGYPYNLRTAEPGDAPKISGSQAVEEARSHERMRVRAVVLARADVQSQPNVLVWAVEYWGRDSISCGPLGGTCMNYRTIIAISLINANSGEGYGTYELARPVGRALS
jgi:hypothetical protein